MIQATGKIQREINKGVVMYKCGKCGSSMTNLESLISNTCSACWHQNNLKQERDEAKGNEAAKPFFDTMRRFSEALPKAEDAQMIKPKYPSPIRNKDLTVKIDDKGVVTGIVHHKENVSKPDMVNKPPHYKDASGIECKEIICHRKMPFSLGNAIKYLYRAGSKGDLLEDLKKAEWYLRVAYLNSETVPDEVVRRLLEVAAVRKTEAGRALKLISRHEIVAAYRVVKIEIEKLESGNE